MGKTRKATSTLPPNALSKEAGGNALRDQLEVERALLEAVLHQMPAGVIIVEVPSGKVLLANQQLVNIWHERAIAGNVEKYGDWKGFHTRDMRPYEAAEWPLTRSMRDGEVVTDEEMFLLREDGTCGTVSVNSAPIRNRQGEIVAAVAILTELTEQRRVAEDLRKLSRAVEQSASTVMITDLEGNIEYANPKFTQLTGYTTDEVKDKNPSILKSGKTSSEEYRRLWATIMNGAEWRGEFLNRKKNGELYWESASISPIRNSAGKITHFLAVKEDITARKRAEEFRDEYVSLVSHDLRTPLTTITGQGQWVRKRLERHGLEQEAAALEAIVKNAKRMNAMIEEIVQSAKLEAGHLELSTQVTDLLQLVSDAVDRIGPADRNRVVVEFPEYVPPVEVDTEQFERAIVNLVTNALKYSALDTKVRVTVSQQDNRALIAVADQGMGIPLADIPYVFDRYFRAKSGRKAEGLGLGLYITRLIVNAHGGDVCVESEEGKGSVFCVSLPLAT